MLLNRRSIYFITLIIVVLFNLISGSRYSNKAEKSLLRTENEETFKNRLQLRKSRVILQQGNSTNGTNSTNKTISTSGGEGTNIFNGKLNSSNAAGLVGPLNFSISSPPYKVERCDQVLLLPGKKLNLKDYCIKEDGFMTLSIYMANLFLTRDSGKLVESIPMDQVTTIPSKLPGAPTCTQFQTRYKSFAFCYETEEILAQVIQAYKDFFRCRLGERGSPPAANIIQACDLKKLDLTENGPFGNQGPIIKSMVEEYRKSHPELGNYSLFDGSFNKESINPYYNTNKVPGS